MKIVMQDGIKDCGICCLLSIIRFYGGEVSKEYLRELTNTTKDGVTLYNLLEASKVIGFESQGMSGKIENINVNNLPCIVHFIVNKNYQHFVVLYEINKKSKKVTIMDPAKGKKIISFSEFNLLTSNNYLFLKPYKTLPVIKKNKVITKLIKESIKSNKKTYITITLLTIIYLIENILTSYNFKYFLEYSINISLSNNILYITIILLILTIFKNINILLKNILLNSWFSKLDLKTTSKTFEQILLLPYLYYKNRTSGEVLARFKDLNTVRYYLSNIFTSLITDIFCIIIFLIILFKYSKELTSIIILIFIITIIFEFLIVKRKKKYIRKINKHQDIINNYLIEGISNVDTIKGRHLEKRLIDKFNIKYTSLLNTVNFYKILLEITSNIKNNLNEVLIIIIYSIGTYLCITNKLTLSNLIIFQAFTNYLLNNFYSILSLIEEYPDFASAKERVEELFMLEEEYFKNSYFYLNYKLDGDIIYNNLTYKNGSKYLFKNLNLTIRKGEKILLSGSSGSGKSTLMKMLLKYIGTAYDTVKIAGIDINHYHLESIRSNITYTTSSEYLFNDTIKNNITLYREYNEEELEKIIEICNINDIIKDSDLGLNKLIEENGFNFSNGERQRIILARSLLRKTNIYIFDEALGQIDITREKKILESMFAYLQDKTVIVISHRFNNKKLFDRVLKLEKGQIYEQKKL